MRAHFELLAALFINVNELLLHGDVFCTICCCCIIVDSSITIVIDINHIFFFFCNTTTLF